MAHLCKFYAKKTFPFQLLIAATALWGSSAVAFDANLQVTPESSQVVGARSSLVASTSVVDSETMEYQFSIRKTGGDWQIVRDFDKFPSIEWSSLDEGSYELRLLAWDTETDEGQVTITPYSVLSRVVNNEPTVNLLQPLVALYSAPPCNGAGFLRVRFRRASGNIADWTTTPPKPCVAGKSVNFILAGMTADTVHIARHEGVVNGSNVGGTPLAFQTEAFDPGFTGTFGLPVPPNPGTSAIDDVLLL
ncbi:MAG: hypothetical protein HKN08_09230, partial [Gammaproteobacteria bacterium]|nr:hypothetical protein [Gammaproteobacteria bacterium]